MSEVYTRNRKRYRQRPAVESSNADGYEFAEWLTGKIVENYAYKITEYCDSIKNCSECQFYNGTCRLNSRPFNWDMKSF